MIRQLAFASKQGMTAETLLWRGVIAVTIQDWLSKPLRPKREAERYLFENSADLSLVCSSAGIDVGQLLTCHCERSREFFLAKSQQKVSFHVASRLKMTTRMCFSTNC
jgi:hypothetical protein